MRHLADLHAIRNKGKSSIKQLPLPFFRYVAITFFAFEIFLAPLWCQLTMCTYVLCLCSKNSEPGGHQNK